MISAVILTVLHALCGKMLVGRMMLRSAVAHVNAAQGRYQQGTARI
jgi:hypothetical protein